MENQSQPRPETQQRRRIDNNMEYPIRTLPKRGYRPLEKSVFPQPQLNHCSFTDSVSSITEYTPVTIVAGRVDVRQFSVAREWLASASNYFSTRLANLSTFYIEDFEPTTFKIFLKWLYNRTLLNKDGNPYNGNEEFPFIELLKLYIFATRFDIPQFHDDVSEAFVANTNGRPIIVPYAELEKAYRQLHDKSSMQPFIEDHYTVEWASGLEVSDTDPNLPPRPVSMVVRLRVERPSATRPRMEVSYPPPPFIHPPASDSDGGSSNGTPFLTPSSDGSNAMLPSRDSFDLIQSSGNALPPYSPEPNESRPILPSISSLLSRMLNDEVDDQHRR